VGCRCGIRKDDRTADADTIIIHREDAGGDGDFDATSGGGDQSWWHLTDVQFSTVAVLNDNAVLQERIAYDPYGRALHHDDKDIDGDRDFDQDDRDIIDTIVNGGGANIEDAAYNVDADLDRDGAIDSTDQSTANNASDAAALATGELSNATVQNTIGWDGYVFNAETREYLVRYRCYSPTLGRWLERDPIGYIGGMSLYQYSSSRSPLLIDPYGLVDDCPRDCPERRYELNTPDAIGARLNPRSFDKKPVPCGYDHRFGMRFSWAWGASEAFRNLMAQASADACAIARSALRVLEDDCEWQLFLDNATVTDTMEGRGGLSSEGFTRAMLLQYLRSYLNKYCTGRTPLHFEQEICPGCEGPDAHIDPTEPKHVWGLYIIDDDIHIPTGTDGEGCPNMNPALTVLHEVAHIELDLSDEGPQSAHKLESLIDRLRQLSERSGLYSHIPRSECASDAEDNGTPQQDEAPDRND